MKFEELKKELQDATLKGKAKEVLSNIVDGVIACDDVETAGFFANTHGIVSLMVVKKGCKIIHSGTKDSCIIEIERSAEV